MEQWKVGQIIQLLYYAIKIAALLITNLPST